MPPINKKSLGNQNPTTPKTKSKDEKALDSSQFLRIGTEYFKRTNQPLISGDSMEVIIKWTKSAIQDDLHGITWKGFSELIPRYDGFCVIPDHLSYEREIRGYYNRYEPFIYQESIAEGDITHSLQFVDHIFGDQRELGLDYLKLLLEDPTQKLPILCLVSAERDTGKSTFVVWLKEIFGGNATINTNADFESNFNADWSSKLLIMVEETLLEKREMGEKLKYLSTTRFTKTEAKGKDKFENEFFGKFVLCSNNEDSFVRIDKEETRYWVRKVNLVKKDPLFHEKLKAEIPAFLHFLINRKLSTTRKTRLWFDENLYVTKELEALKKNSRDLVEKELEDLIINHMEDLDLTEICYTISDLLQELKKVSSIRFTAQQVQVVLRKKWHLEPAGNALSYLSYYWIDSNHFTITKKGRYYKFKMDFFKDAEAVPESVNKPASSNEDGDEDLPF